ncbi:MAG: uroporphyrinogen decarboxylase family protein [Acidimicrobiales bacterium]|jgi:hypothetical protein
MDNPYTPYALVGEWRYKNFWGTVTWLLGFERALIALVTEQDFVQALLEKLYELNETACKQSLRIAGPYLTAVHCSDDLGTQQSLLFSPKTYRSIPKPFHSRFFSLIKRYTNAKIRFLTDGSVVPLLDDLIEAGIDALNPVQCSAVIDPAGVKARLGDRLSFWGSIDTQHVLPHGTPEQVREEVGLRIQQLGKGGGFVATSVHNMQADVPPENILAMSDAVHELGRYSTRRQAEPFVRHAFNPVLIPLTVGLAAGVLVPNRAYTRSPITSTGATDDIFADLLAERKPAHPTTVMLLARRSYTAEERGGGAIAASRSRAYVVARVMTLSSRLRSGCYNQRSRDGLIGLKGGLDAAYCRRLANCRGATAVPRC